MLQNHSASNYGRADDSAAINALIISIIFLSCHAAAGSCSIESGYNQNISGNAASWDLTNYGNAPLTICSISLAWPQRAGNLKQIRLGDRVIYNGDTAWSASTALISTWNGDESYRAIAQGQTSAVKLYFEKDISETVPSQYNLTMSFCECCAVQFQPDSIRRCNLLGGANLSIEGNDIEWDVTNRGNSEATICSIGISWPQSGGRLKQVYLGGEEISSPDQAWTGKPADIPNWNGRLFGHTIGQGQTKTLRISFEKDIGRTSPKQYKIEINFCEGCRLEFLPSERICNIISGDLIIDDGDKIAKLNITNWGNAPITLCRVQLGARAGHGGLNQMRLGGEKIFSGYVAPPDMNITGINGRWTGNVSSRTIGQGQTKTLELYFDKMAKGRYYPLILDSMMVNFCPCFIEIYPTQPATCAKQCAMCEYYSEVYRPPADSRPICGITGPDAVCIDFDAMYYPNLMNGPNLENYIYIWSVDGGDEHQGNSFTIKGRSCPEGDHMLKLSVKDGTKEISSCSKLVRIVSVPPFTITQV
jgi:hypothetical protein